MGLVCSQTCSRFVHRSHNELYQTAPNGVSGTRCLLFIVLSLISVTAVQHLELMTADQVVKRETLICSNVSCCFKRKCLSALKCGRCCLNWFTPDIYSQVFDFWTFCTSCQQISICLTQKIWRKKCHWVSYLLQTVVILWRNAFKGKITHTKWANIYHFGLSVFIYYIVLCFCCLVESLLGHLRESFKRSH